MRDGNADPPAGAGRLETTEHAVESGDGEVASATRTEPSNGASRRRPADDDAQRGAEREPDEHASIRMNDRCATCNEYIGPRAYRLSRVIDTAVATLEIHYCSETCFLARDRSTGSSGPDQRDQRDRRNQRPEGSPAGTETRGARSSNGAESDSQPQDWSYCR
ncbi:hypothetical protein [Natrarchaeobaculum aegyptiacum]|uniref:Uncharacterized protein n=1 Tax=Natrarchaeobaculum aegyptiacum TaxID=745377 RepID=A0A2Z2HPF7_9EURY|nr:hypothetical protein [Natrarchaeobaculum aegyptiacum]ARS88861.1 hypothetical protein B1756_03225 [Natrarchaeobaculum aegyptiacum]